MLTDFPIDLRVASRRGAILVRDIPASSFFAGFPDPSEPVRVAHQWVGRALLAVTVDPDLRAVIDRLDVERESALALYLQAVGLALEAPIPKPAWLIAAIVATLGGSPKDTLKRIAERVHRLPWPIWQLPVSEFAFNATILLAPEKPAPEIYTNDPGLLGEADA